MSPRSDPEEDVRFRQRAASGATTAELADEFSINPRSVLRRKHRLGMAIQEKHRGRHLSEEQDRFARVSRGEGIPSVWVAETIGWNPGSVTRRYPMGEEATREWRAVWLQIRKDPVLLALHRELSPPPLTVLRAQ